MTLGDDHDSDGPDRARVQPEAEVSCEEKAGGETAGKPEGPFNKEVMGVFNWCRDTGAQTQYVNRGPSSQPSPAARQRDGNDRDGRERPTEDGLSVPFWVLIGVQYSLTNLLWMADVLRLAGERGEKGS